MHCDSKKKGIDNTVRIITPEEDRVARTPAGTGLLNLLDQHHVLPGTYCNGKGICGKCRVRVAPIDASGFTPEERGVLSPFELKQGYRLACQATVNGDLTVYAESDDQFAIVTAVSGTPERFNPMVRRERLTVAAPTLNDQTADADRLALQVGAKSVAWNLQMLQAVSALPLDREASLTLVRENGRIVGVEGRPLTAGTFGVALDLGTTTLAGYLVDLNTGEQAGTAALLNPQTRFGADVVTRIQHSTSEDKGLQELQEALVKGITTLVGQLCKKAAISDDAIYHLVCCGNTTLMHFLLGLSPARISNAPFIPVTTKTFSCRAAELSIKLNPWARLTVMPGVAAYVGADTVAAVLSCNMHRQETLTLLVDLGTNGEMVLGNRHGLIACATAAGPAFEGARISHGMGSCSGAIEAITLAGGVQYSVIGDGTARGICGSGLIDLIAELLAHGIINKSGRMLTPEELSGNPLQSRVVSVNAQPAFKVADGEHGPILLTQKDVRQVQAAKAAVCAGIHALLQETKTRARQVDKVFLAGGLGNAIRARNGARIGLIPEDLSDKTCSVGNAAGTGALLAMTDKDRFRQSQRIAESMAYVELSGAAAFNEHYIDAMLFP